LLHFKEYLASNNSKDLLSLNHEWSFFIQSFQKPLKQIRDLLAKAEQEKSKLAAILDGMEEGVMMTDEEGRILLINQALRKMLGLLEDCVGKTVLECLRREDLHLLVTKTIFDHLPQNTRMQVPFGEGDRTIMVHTVPLTTQKTMDGTISVFFDLTEVVRLENVRRDFVANVSHELKTPLTSIIGYSETLIETATEEMQKRFLTKIYQSSLHLKRLVDDILELSAIESGRAPIHPEEISLIDFFEVIKEEYAESFGQKQILFNLQANTPTLTADPEALRHILQNLLDNALRYTPEGGVITLRSLQKTKEIDLEVEDTGSGIPREDLSRIFERFYRVDKSHSRDHGGTGLGLAIVKHMVKAHGGSVSATSEKGHGTLFTIRFPQN